ncbi:hypothetical protein DFH09DRAFT_1374853 [Mycena vulgaris]|nr:hypothetical protein DFH09DRAFT_1374853 [Mycena vulgaris]
MAAPTDATTPAAELATPDAEVVKPQAAAPTSTDAAAAESTISIPESPALVPTAASPEPTPPPAAEESASPPREREMVQDARLGVLRAMFPDFDDSLLQSVLDSVHGNTDQAIDALLGMSDPDYTSEQPAVTQQAPQTQEELDEQLARTLMLEDEREAHAWRAQQPAPPRPEARRRTSEGAPEKDTMQEFQEQFNKFAETGKKTFGSLFSKVKAKIQEFDQPAGQSSSGGAYGTGAGGDTYPYEAHQNPYPTEQQQYQQQQQQAQAQAQTPAYYDPNAPSANPSPPSSAGYDAAPRSMSPPGAATASPPSTNAGRPQIDGGKLGMLPKRPVSLLRTNSPPAAAAAPHPSSRSDDDELEYAENPFEDGKK